MIGDQLLMYYGFSHRSVKWWKRVFFHLLDLVLVNSHILYREATESRISQLDFRLAVARSLVEGYTRPQHRHRHPSTPELPLRLTERAFPEPIPGNERIDCVVCSNRGAGQRHTTGYRCKLSCTLMPIPLFRKVPYS